MGSRPSPRRILAILGIAFALLAGSSALWVHLAVDRAWTALEHRTEAELTRINSRDPRRPPILGPALPGNAWDDYLPALRNPPARTVAPPVGPESSPSDPEPVSRQVEQAEAWAATVLKGARRERSRYEYPEQDHRQWREPEGVQGAAGTLQLLATWKGTQLVREGKQGEAVALLLDLAVFGRDLSDR